MFNLFIFLTGLWMGIVIGFLIVLVLMIAISEETEPTKNETGEELEA